MPTESKRSLDKTEYRFRGKGEHPNSDEVTSVPNLTSSEDNPFERAEKSASSSKSSKSTSSSRKES